MAENTECAINKAWNQLKSGTYKSEDGNNYYELALNLKTGDKVLIENASCTAVAQELAEKYFIINSSLYIPK